MLKSLAKLVTRTWLFVTSNWWKWSFVSVVTTPFIERETEKKTVYQGEKQSWTRPSVELNVLVLFRYTLARLYYTASVWSSLARIIRSQAQQMNTTQCSIEKSEEKFSVTWSMSKENWSHNSTRRLCSNCSNILWASLSWRIVIGVLHLGETMIDYTMTWIRSNERS